jgi:predicted RNA binding protein YcfA (HicA-like mRNA interferase family)
VAGGPRWAAQGRCYARELARKLVDMRPSKTWQAILDGSRNVRFQDLLQLAVALGFVLRRVRGSHHILVHPSVPDALNLQPDPGGKAKLYQIRQLVDLVETYGLELGG